jgi:hypothetical protein
MCPGCSSAGLGQPQVIVLLVPLSGTSSGSGWKMASSQKGRDWMNFWEQAPAWPQHNLAQGPQGAMWLFLGDCSLLLHGHLWQWVMAPSPSPSLAWFCSMTESATAWTLWSILSGLVHQLVCTDGSRAGRLWRAPKLGSRMDAWAVPQHRPNVLSYLQEGRLHQCTMGQAMDFTGAISSPVKGTIQLGPSPVFLTLPPTY